MNLAATLVLLSATASAEVTRLGLFKAAVSDAEPPESEERSASVGVFYGEPWPRHHAGRDDSNRTEAVAKMIAAEVGDGVEATLFEDMPEGFDFSEFDSIIVGAPTYNTGEAFKRSSTGWDEWLYDTLPNIDISGKNVAVFCTGKAAYLDREGGYPENFGDVAGELYDRFAEKGTTVFGFTSTEGYNPFTASKAIRNGKFVGQVFDQKSQEELSPGRAKNWVAQLREEGFFTVGGDISSSTSHD